MALDKNDGIFSPSIEGVISGKTSQVDGMNGLLNDLIGNDNYLKDKKLDRGNYNGTAEKLNNGINSTWGGEYVGDIQDSIVKEVNKHYRDRINGKGYRCIKSGNSNITTNTTEYFEPCNVVDNLDKLQNLFEVYSITEIASFTHGGILGNTVLYFKSLNILIIDFTINSLQNFRITNSKFFPKSSVSCVGSHGTTGTATFQLNTDGTLITRNIVGGTGGYHSALFIYKIV